LKTRAKARNAFSVCITGFVASYVIAPSYLADFVNGLEEQNKFNIYLISILRGFVIVNTI